MIATDPRGLWALGNRTPPHLRSWHLKTEQAAETAYLWREHVRRMQPLRGDIARLWSGRLARRLVLERDLAYAPRPA